MPASVAPSADHALRLYLLGGFRVVVSERETPFVFIRADCFGGRCLYEGYVCENGAILHQAQDLRGCEGGALPRLVQALGVELATPPFVEPLTRGFFDRSR